MINQFRTFSFFFLSMKITFCLLEKYILRCAFFKHVNKSAVEHFKVFLLIHIYMFELILKRKLRKSGTSKRLKCC